MTENAPGAVWGSRESALRAAYYAFVVWIPIETLFVFDPNRNGSTGGFTISKLLGIILFVLAIVEWRRCFRKIPAVTWLLAFYVVVYALSELTIPRFLGGRFRASQFTMLQLIALFVISTNLFDDGDFRAGVLRLYGWWTTFVALAMILGIFGHQFATIEGRYTLLGEDPNAAAGLYALAAVCIAGNRRLFGSRGFSLRVISALCAIIVLITAIFQTGSRGGLLAFIAGIGGLAICGNGAGRRKRMLIASGVLILLAGMVVVQFKRGSTAAIRMQRAWTDGDTAGRTEIWNVAWSMFWERPLLGYGGVNNVYALGERLNYAEGANYSRSTHNLLLATLTEVGLVGAVPFLGSFLCGLWLAWRYGRRSDDPMPFALMCSLITINTSITWEHEKVFWIVFSAAVACGSKGATAPQAVASDDESTQEEPSSAWAPVREDPA